MRSRGRAANEEPNDSTMIANDFVATFLGYCIYLFLGASTRAQSVNNRPNVVFMLIDDLGTDILFQTPFFKFSGAQESIYIFAKQGIEPWGRIVSGVVELMAVILLLNPSTGFVGAILSLGTVSVAILSHLTKLGIVVINSDCSSDGGLLLRSR